MAFLQNLPPWLASAFALWCALNIVRTAVEVLPELLAVSRSVKRRPAERVSFRTLERPLLRRAA